MAPLKQKKGPGPCVNCGTEKVQQGRVQRVWVCRPCKAAQLRATKARFGGSAAYRNRWKKANREKYLAWKSVEKAIWAGRLKPCPCEVCGAENAHAHHDDYSRRLDVMWLCPRHHKERHHQLDAMKKSSHRGFAHAAPATGVSVRGDAPSIH